jgi:hypothetical protein
MNANCEPPIRQRATSEDGGVAVIVAVMFAVVFLAAGAVAIDLGSMWATQRDLATSTDGGAVAGAVELASYFEEQDNIGVSYCPHTNGVWHRWSQYAGQDLTTDSLWRTIDEVRSVVEANGSDEDPAVRISCVPVHDEGPEGTNELIAYDVKIEVLGSQAAKSTFGPAVGGPQDPSIEGLTISEFRAKAHWNMEVITENKTTGDSDSSSTDNEQTYFLPESFAPLAVCMHRFERDDAKNATEQNPALIDIRYKWQGPGNPEPCAGVKEQGVGAVPGNWGWIDSPTACREATSEGGDNWCKGDPGNNTAQHSFSEWIDQPITFLLFKTAAQQGNKAEFEVVGYATGIFRGCDSAPGQGQGKGKGSDNDCQGNPDRIFLEVTGVALPKPPEVTESDEDEEEEEIEIVTYTVWTPTSPKVNPESIRLCGMSGAEACGRGS